MSDKTLNPLFKTEGEYYWVRCPSQTPYPMIAEKTQEGWLLVGTDYTYTDDAIVVEYGPIPYDPSKSSLYAKNAK